MRSKSGQPLERYFPELSRIFQALGANRFVLDGEIVIPAGEGFSFDQLLQRIHPAATRIQKLSTEHPAAFVAFDLLVDERGTLLTGLPLSERRKRLESFAVRHFGGTALRLSELTADTAAAQGWLRSGGGRVDGLVAKRLDAPYQPGERTGAFLKIKSLRTADCVVGGFRYGTKTAEVGSLLLGLYDREGLLHHVGFTSALPAAERAGLTLKLEALIEPPGFTGRAPGGPSRWSTRRSTEWQPLAPRLVVEVQYDHFTGGRFRHGTRLLRWRPDKSPRQCILDQVSGS
jgi:ATP-dependent DNA ligase